MQDPQIRSGTVRGTSSTIILLFFFFVLNGVAPDRKIGQSVTKGN
jgi:hypothetical protein